MSKWHTQVGLDEIGIWGVEMEHGTEYRQQRAGFRHFIALARGLGITITLLAAGGLSYEPVPYPLWQDDPLINKLGKRQEATAKALKESDLCLRNTRSMIAQNRAMIEEIERSKKKGYRRAKRLAELESELANLMTTSANLSKEITYAEGVNEEQRWLKDYLTP